MAQRFEGLDILGAFQVGNQIRSSRQANDREDANLQRLYEQDAAQAAAEEQRQAIALEGRRLDLQNNKAKARAEETALMQQRAARALALRPENRRYIQQQIDNMAAGEHIDHFQLPGGPGFSEAGPPTEQEAATTGAPTQDEVGQFAAMAGVEPKEDPYGKPTSDMLNYRAGQADPNFRKYEQETNKGKQMQVTVSNGAVDASKKTVTDQEAELLDAQDQLALLGDIAKLATPQGGKDPDFSQFLGWAPKGKKFALDVLDSISPESVPPESREWYDKMSQFRSYVDEYKAGRYNKLLGSAQSQSEVRNLINAVLSADMGTTQFNAAFSRMQAVLPRKIRIAEQVLAEGIPLGGRDYRKRFEAIEKGEEVSGKIKPGAEPPAKGIRPEVQRVIDKIKNGEQLTAAEQAMVPR